MIKLHRSKENGIITGVCAGIAETFGVPANIVRVLFILVAPFGGTGLLIYLALSLILPKQDDNIIDTYPEKEADKIYRSKHDCMIAGVCSGLAHHLNWDASIVRILFVLMGLAGGIGILMYLFFWFLFPREQ